MLQKRSLLLKLLAEQLDGRSLGTSQVENGNFPDIVSQKPGHYKNLKKKTQSPAFGL